MPLFSVTTKHDSNDEKLRAAITEHFPNDNFEFGRGQWLVVFDGTSKELYKSLFPNEDDPETVTRGILLFVVGGYYGRAQADLWEWMANKLEK